MKNQSDILYTSAIFTSLFLRTTIPTFYNKNILPTSAISSIQATSRDQRARESCEEWHCFNLSLFFLKVWAVITGLAITNSLSLRFRKLVYCRYNKPSNPPSLIPSTYSHNFHILLIRPQEPTFPCNRVA